MSSTEKFVKWFQEYFQTEFPDLKTSFKNDLIEEILLDNAKYITKEDIMRFDGCSQCGRCCISQGCPHVDESGLCTRHDNPIDDICKEYPWGGEMGIAPLLLNCDYQVAFFIDYFNNFFESHTQMG